MTGHSREFLIEEELFMVSHSGEIPEITLHSAMYYLCESPEGEQLILSKKEQESLQDAAIERSMEIVLRDLDPDNRDKSIYRGVARSIANYGRMQAMCQRLGRLCPGGFRDQVAIALRAFLCREAEDVASGQRASSINASATELAAFAGELGLDPAELPAGWERLCPKG